MGKVEFFQINLDKPNGIYSPGEFLSGKLVLKVSERFKINALNINLEGNARVHWTESQGTGKNRRTHTYSNDEQYLSFVLVFASKQPNQDCYLEVGEQFYPFNIMLPPNLPTSYEQSVGKIRYSLTGNIDIPWAFDKHTKRQICIINHYNLNDYPLLQNPCHGEASKVFGVIFQEAPAIARLSISKTGFVPGEQIIFSVYVDNQSKKAINQMKISLIQISRFHARSKSKTVRITSISLPLPYQVESGSQQNFRDLTLVIPPVCSSSNGACRIIDVSYVLNLNYGRSGMSINADIDIPIIIGTIPSGENFIGTNIDSQQASAPQLPYTFEISPPYDPSAPPMYEEVAHKGEMYTNDHDTFQPSYPYYRNLSIK